jgi:hypothetical protein
VRCEYGCAAGLPQLLYVINFAIEDYPSDPGVHGRFCNLGKAGSADRFENNAVGTSFGVTLNELQYLLALQNGIIVGIENLDIATDGAAGFFGSGGLFNLIVVVLRE